MLADHALVHRAVIARAGLAHAVVKILDTVLHVGVEADALLHHEEVFGQLLHPFHIGGVVFGAVACALFAHVAVVAAHLVTHLAAQQLVGGHIRSLAGNVPQRMLDDADRRAIGLERAALADFQHHPLDVGWVLADQRVAKVQHPGFDVALGEFDFAQAVDAFVGGDADDGVAANDSAAQIGDFHRVSSRCGPRNIHRPSGSSAARCRWRPAADARRSPRQPRRQCQGRACQAPR